MYENIYYNPQPMYRQRISMQQASQIALQNIPGQVLHVNMDMENGILVYEVFILTAQNKMYEVEINAKTGAIMKIEEESDFD